MTGDLEAVVSRSISDPKLLEKTFADPKVAPLFKGMLQSTAENMNKWLVGTKNDIRISRNYEYPMESLDLPVLVVHGKLDQHVPFSSHAVSLRIPVASDHRFRCKVGHLFRSKQDQSFRCKVGH